MCRLLARRRALAHDWQVGNLPHVFLAAVVAAVACLAPLVQAAEPKPAEAKVFRAGAHAIDITPQKLPVIVNGGFIERTEGRVSDPLHARCLVLDDGTTRVAFAVVDSCVIPQSVIDEAKRLASQSTGIPAGNMMVSATHTHSAPALVGALGSRADEEYAKYAPGRIAEGIRLAAANLARARVGWTAVDVPEGTACRRWVTRPDRMQTDPFGQRTVRAMMHPGFQNPDYVGPAGPKDPGLSLLSVQSLEGRPVALLANYSMHYHGAGGLSADYYGAFAGEVRRLLGAEKTDPPFVGIMSQGTSGDLHNRDYDQPKMRWESLQHYANFMAQRAAEACKTIRYRDWVSLAVAGREVTMRRRVPDAERLAWARQMAAKMGDRVPRDRPEVYALEAIYLHEDPVRTFRLQAIRVGELGIAAIPCEVFGITGLKIKAQSPLQPTFNVELANGYEGYIPPPEQHKLGGYTTWPARSAALEESAEPKIVETVLELLEEVSGRPRRPVVLAAGPYVEAVLQSKPSAYWRLGDFAGPEAKDSSPHGRAARYEDGVAFYLEGPTAPGLRGPGQTARAAHFAGGRLKGEVPDLSTAYTLEAWFWNGLPDDARAVTGYVFARGPDGAAGEALGIGGKDAAPGKLFFSSGDGKAALAGSTAIPLRTWTHVALVRDGKNMAVYLNGAARPELSGEAPPGCDPAVKQVFVGGRGDGKDGFEGTIAEAAVYARALSPEEVSRHYAAAVKNTP